MIVYLSAKYIDYEALIDLNVSREAVRLSVCLSVASDPLHFRLLNKKANGVTMRNFSQKGGRKQMDWTDSLT